MDVLTRKQFHALAPDGGVVPVYREVPADVETPVSVYLKIRQRGPGFLLESAEQAEQVGRFSFLGVAPRRQIVSHGRNVELRGLDAHHGPAGSMERRRLPPDLDPLHAIADVLASYKPVAPIREFLRDTPRFIGGAVGYLGYDLVRFFETLPATARDDLRMPDVHMLVAEDVIVFDHLRRRVLLFANARIPPGSNRRRRDVIYDETTARLDELERWVGAPMPASPALIGSPAKEPFTSTMRQDEFERAVRRAREHIARGDIFQVVLSQRLRRGTSVDPFQIYRVLRRLNPSPYMFYLGLGGRPSTCLIGSSPEMLMRVEDDHAEIRPIAGTRPRGHTEAEDRVLETELLEDPKERAEHIMLVDLGRNDIGRVAAVGSVEVADLLTVERYSHVIHLVSSVRGRLRDDVDAFDALRATFPAGTVSGAPKVRAMELIETLEGIRRGPYAGAVGYIGFDGNADTCITIRTIVMQGNTAYVQAGAGIVADSDPTREWEETLHKARALGVAIEQAEMKERSVIV